MMIVNIDPHGPPPFFLNLSPLGSLTGVLIKYFTSARMHHFVLTGLTVQFFSSDPKTFAKSNESKTILKASRMSQGWMLLRNS
jgi:hypothetical protein